MNDAIARRAQAPTKNGGRLLAWNYAATIFTSAFLLFEVQPIVSRFILPWFGGSPAVWTTCMVFFQSVLFAGYLYAHLNNRYLPAWAQMSVHAALLAAAWFFLPIAPDASWKPTADVAPTGRILLLLLSTVGLPYFVLSSTGPLVQAWFSRSFPGRSPYRLYALSNFGSLLALISYPFYVEPRWSLVAQDGFWSAGFVAFAVLCGLSAAWAYGTRDRGQDNRTASVLASAPAPTWSRRLLWLVLPAFASVALLATTNHVCQDVAVIPFLWVAPLSLYLLTFIICFDHERWYWPRATALAAVVSLCLAATTDSLITGGSGISFTFLQELVIYFSALFFVCMLCHGELVRLKPDPKYLTSFYLMIAAGGALGGWFVSLIAPVIFSTFFEWKIALFGGVLLAALVALSRQPMTPFSRKLYWAAPLVVLAFFGVNAMANFRAAGERELFETRRNFYGLVSVVERDRELPDEHRFQLYSGRIVHGIQYQAKERRHEPNAYFGRAAGIGRAFAALGSRPSLRVGVIGLGAGVLTTYIRPGDTLRYYEINADIEQLAREHFTLLDDCRGTVDVVLGDGRLSLEFAEPERFDLLVLDAFSGDAVPTHLLTREALAIYLKHVKPDGIIALNIANRYLNLAPVVRGLAAEAGWQAIHVRSAADPARGEFDADWMILARDPSLVAELEKSASEPVSGNYPRRLWTDDHSNLFEILK